MPTAGLSVSKEGFSQACLLVPQLPPAEEGLGGGQAGGGPLCPSRALGGRPVARLLADLWGPKQAIQGVGRPLSCLGQWSVRGEGEGGFWSWPERSSWPEPPSCVRLCILLWRACQGRGGGLFLWLLGRGGEGEAAFSGRGDCFWVGGGSLHGPPSP